MRRGKEEGKARSDECTSKCANDSQALTHHEVKSTCCTNQLLVTRPTRSQVCVTAGVCCDGKSISARHETCQQDRKILRWDAESKVLVPQWKAELGGVAGNCVGSLEAAFCMMVSKSFVGKMFEESSGSELDMCPRGSVDMGHRDGHSERLLRLLDSSGAQCGDPTLLALSVTCDLVL